MTELELLAEIAEHIKKIEYILDYNLGNITGAIRGEK